MLAFFTFIAGIIVGGAYGFAGGFTEGYNLGEQDNETINTRDIDSIH